MPPVTLDTEHLLICTIFIGAALLHGISGIGITLVTTTALASNFGLTHAILLVVIPSLVLNAMTWLLGGNRSIWQNAGYYLRRYWLLALMSLLGSILGAKLLLWVNSGYLMLMLTVVIGYYVTSAAFGKQIRLSNTPVVLVLVGISAGIVGGATNAMSPILLMYLLSASNDKNTIAKVGNLCYLLGKLAQIGVLWQPLTQMPQSEWLLILLLTLLSIIGLMIGIRLRHYLPQARFRQLILIILATLGVKIGWQGLVQIIVN